MTDLVWLRRDLRRADLPTLAAAAEHGDVAVLFVIDPQFWDPAGPGPRRWLAATLLALRDTYEGRLTLRRGDPRTVVPQVAREIDAVRVHISQETEPGGGQRDVEVEAALASGGVTLVRTGSPYAVTPGRVRTKDGGPYRVFTPFLRAWREHGWRAPATEPEALTLADDLSDPSVWELVAAEAASPGSPLPPAGEEAAHDRWSDFLESGLDAYATERNRPALDATSRMSPYLKLGVVHPRTLLADILGRSGNGVERYVAELAWREFYADVLHHHPDSVHSDLRADLSTMLYDDEGPLTDAWREGRTGYPIVDAGMRQLSSIGWMHNRVRMITASFLTKHLHTRWQVGAQHFHRLLIDADLASNYHGWQWVAGTGTDPSPYFRIFNPVLQGERFDPDGTYIRRWVPELAGLRGKALHQPWTVAADQRPGYPDPVVELDVERKEALARYEAARQA